MNCVADTENFTELIKKSLVYVKSVRPNVEHERLVKTVLNRLDKIGIALSISHVASLEELFKILSNPNNSVDVVTIDHDYFNAIEDTDVFGIVNAIRTLVKCKFRKPINIQVFTGYPDEI